jgi:polysaccharide biosynthesis protein PslA
MTNVDGEMGVQSVSDNSGDSVFSFEKDTPEITPQDINAPLPAISTPTRSRHELIRTRIMLSMAALLGDSLLIILAFLTASVFRLGKIDADQLMTLLAVTLPVYLGIAANSSAFNHRVISNFWQSLRKVILSFLFAATVVLLYAFFLKTSAQFSRVIFGLGAGLAIILLIGFRSMMASFSRWATGNNSLAQLVIFEGEEFASRAGPRALDAQAVGLTRNMVDPVNIQFLGNIAKDFERIVVHCRPEHRREWANALKSLDVDCQLVVPELDEISPIGVTRFEGKLALTISAGPLQWNERFLKRAFDLTLVLLALPFLLPIMLLTAIAIKMESRGPVLFRQTRIGLGNRPFKILKFRSMRAEKTDAHGARSASRDDDRVTRIGAFIRKTSIDELPQIFNILQGDMSIVGPRPHAVGSTAEDELFWDIASNYWHRHAMKPGLTGLAQIRGFRGATESKEDLQGRLDSDLEYRAQWSIWKDIKIVLLTFKVMVHKNAF